ncbi:LytR C-terminal domain-containing protein [Intrasporangium sp.]|uniref:LytR C-terminal domain-containing protein n=1 Tax=Intrasporangium sp. TaxID=1925024 RepID=UPI0032217405
MTQPDDGYEYRAKRQRRTTVTIVVLVLALAAAFYYASSYFRDTTPEPSASCTTVLPPAQPLQPADVSVNVYNATTRNGLAGATSKVLAERGFKIRKVANDPLRKKIKKVAEIRYGASGKSSAELLARHVPGAVLVKDKRKDDSVDLVIGNAWKRLGPVPAQPAATPTLPPCPGGDSPGGS